MELEGYERDHCPFVQRRYGEAVCEICGQTRTQRRLDGCPMIERTADRPKPPKSAEVRAERHRATVEHDVTGGRDEDVSLTFDREELGGHVRRE